MVKLNLGSESIHTMTDGRRGRRRVSRRCEEEEGRRGEE